MEQNILDLIYDIFQIAIIPLLGVLVPFVVMAIKNKSKQIQAQTNSDIINEYIAIAEKVVVDCVVATNQTVVDTLKKQGVFTKEEWANAFETTRENIFAILTEAEKEVLAQVYSDLDTWVDTKIEATVKTLKERECE